MARNKKVSVRNAMGRRNHFDPLSSVGLWAAAKAVLPGRGKQRSEGFMG